MEKRTGKEEKEQKIICWKSSITGKTGHGMPIEEDLAKAWIEYGNRECPNIHHWMEGVN